MNNGNVQNGATAAKAYCPSCAAKPVAVAGNTQKLAKRPAQAGQQLRAGSPIRVVRPGSFQ